VRVNVFLDNGNWEEGSQKLECCVKPTCISSVLKNGLVSFIGWGTSNELV